MIDDKQVVHGRPCVVKEGQVFKGSEDDRLMDENKLLLIIAIQVCCCLIGLCPYKVFGNRLVDVHR